MKKLEIIIRPERLDDLKTILNSNGAHGLMISNIMGYGSQRGHKQVYNGVDFGGNLLPKVKVESIVSDETYETIIDQVIEQINTGEYGDGSLFSDPIFCFWNFGRRLDLLNAGNARFFWTDFVIDRNYGNLFNEYS